MYLGINYLVLSSTFPLEPMAWTARVSTALDGSTSFAILLLIFHMLYAPAVSRESENNI